MIQILQNPCAVHHNDTEEYVIVAKPEMYWLNLREHGGYGELMRIVASSLENREALLVSGCRLRTLTRTVLRVRTH